jgi:hypothetical protein
MVEHVDHFRLARAALSSQKSLIFADAFRVKRAERADAHWMSAHMVYKDQHVKRARLGFSTSVRWERASARGCTLRARKKLAS